MRRGNVYLWIAVGAVVAFVFGLLVVDGSAQALIVIGAVLVFLIAVVRALDSDSYRSRDAQIPTPPGAGGHD